ncbi:MAG: hypothetical protein LBT43_19630 [Prevotella sp.]|jgi:hypothetical protein|nr:hypothetical protein [Prevotella sp.]
MDEILVKHYMKKTIIDSLNTTYPTVRKALRGKGDTDLIMKIREKALELGGVEVKDND